MLPLLRSARPADIDDVLAFWCAAAESTDRHDTAEALQSLISRDPQALTVAIDDGVIVGSLIAG